MAELNKLDCEGTVENTGFGGCAVDFGPRKGGFLVPANKVWKKSELVDLQATLKAAVLAAKADRIYPFHGWEGVTINTQDPNFFNFPSGRSVFIKENDVDVTYQFADGANCLNNSLRTFNNNLGYALIRYDADWKLEGTTKLDSDGEPGFAGIPLKLLFVFAPNENDHTNPTVFRARFAFDPSYITKKLAFVQADFDPSEIKGLQDINLSVVGTPTGGVYQVKATTGCSQKNLFSLYSTALASASLWKVYSVATGAELDITSVAANAGLEAFTVTLDTADTDYTAVTATGKIRIELADPTALDAADVSGYEGIPVTVVRGA